MFQDTSSLAVVQTRCKLAAYRTLADVAKRSYGRIRGDAQIGLESNDPIAALEQIHQTCGDEVIQELCDDTLVPIRLTIGLAEEDNAKLLNTKLLEAA